MRTKFKTREEWLGNAIQLLKDKVFTLKGYKVPKDIKISCGFPHVGAFASRKQRVGECWYPQSGNNHQIFISPVLHEPVRVLDILTHELVHTIAGPAAGHRSPFRVVAVSVGLEGKMTATVAGEELLEKLKKFNRSLGNYPHDPLSKMISTHKKDGIRQIKAWCEECGYTIRLTRKWIDSLGLPECPGCSRTLQEA